jgi:hypothetical protein
VKVFVYDTDPDDETAEIEWTLEYDVEPYRPATRWDPAEGGILPGGMWRGNESVEFMDYPRMYDRLMMAAEDNEHRRADALDAIREDRYER